MGREAKDAPLSIMYVEDDPVTRALVAQTLPKKFPDFTIRTAENGRLGLQLYREYQPDIVITDVNMPIMNGILMAAEIKAINPDVVIIAVTAYSETNYLLNAIEIGISHYVLKPIDYRKLFEAIEKSSAGIRLRKELAAQNKLISELNAALETTVLQIRKEQEGICSAILRSVAASMTMISERGQNLLSKASNGQQESAQVEVILREAESVGRLLRRVHHFTHLSVAPITRSPVNLSCLAEIIAGNLQRQEPGRQVSFRIAGDVTVDGDESLLRIVMENLLENAWNHACPDGNGIIEFGSTNCAGTVSCFVRDNGQGLDPERVQGLMSFRENSGGAESDRVGLGLATVSRIINLHGGTLEVGGEPGKGAIFSFTV